MKNKSENDIYFDALQERYFRILIYTYDRIVNQGNDKNYAKVWGAIGIKFSTFGYQNPYINEIIEQFKHIYKLGYSIDAVLEKIPYLKNKHLLQMEEEHKKSTKTHFHYKNKIMEILRLPSAVSSLSHYGPYTINGDIIYETNDRKVIKILVKYFAVQRFYYEYLEKELDEIKDENLFERLIPQSTSSKLEVHDKEPVDKIIHSKLTWIGENKTEFVQIVYALYHAKLISNETNEITKIVTDLADIFGITLGANWQSNHSKSKNNRNNDYIPKVFDRLKDAYIKYSNSDK